MTVNVCVFTGSRAEYGLLAPILRAIRDHEALTLHVLVGGSHVHAEFGATAQAITADGFDACVYQSQHVPTIAGELAPNAETIALTVLGVGRALQDLRPDWLLVYGDRCESFGAAIAATQAGVRLAHIEGGDVTEGGSLDDRVRYAISMLADRHYPTHQAAADRLVSMGISQRNITVVGLPTLDSAVAGDMTPPAELRERYGLTGLPLYLVCYHPVRGLTPWLAGEVGAIVEALTPSVAKDRGHLIALAPNGEPGSATILSAYNAAGWPVHPSLPRRDYAALLAYVGRCGGAVVGNSSAGIKEAPWHGARVINVGNRQRGRACSPDVDRVMSVGGYDLTIAINSTGAGITTPAHTGPYQPMGAGAIVAQSLATIR